MYIKVLAATVAALAVASSASAQIAVSIYTNSTGATTAAANATLAQTQVGGALFGVAPSATTTVNAINFDSLGSANYTIGGFLNNPVGLSPAIGALSLNNTYLLLTGQTYLNAGVNSFVVAHDDGLQLNINGIGLVVNQPGPTAPVNTPFNVTAPSAGLYSFQLSYGETAGPPATLRFAINGNKVGGVPEPSTWAMMLLGFGAIGMATRSRRRRAVPQIA
ncbi:MAG: hypothetical protein NVSMB6_20840 [Burkholderiaceae bacterium]